MPSRDTLGPIFTVFSMTRSGIEIPTLQSQADTQTTRSLSWLELPSPILNHAAKLLDLPSMFSLGPVGFGHCLKPRVVLIFLCLSNLQLQMRLKDPFSLKAADMTKRTNKPRKPRDEESSDEVSGKIMGSSCSLL